MSNPWWYLDPAASVVEPSNSWQLRKQQLVSFGLMRQRELVWILYSFLHYLWLKKGTRKARARKMANVCLFKSYVLMLPSRESPAPPALSSTDTEAKCTSTCLISLQPSKLRKPLYTYPPQIPSDVTEQVGADRETTAAESSKSVSENKDGIF